MSFAFNRPLYFFALVLAVILIDDCVSEGSEECAYVNVAGTGIPIGFCHVFSNYGQIAALSFTCTKSNKLNLKMVYDSSDCSSSSAWNFDPHRYYDIEDYSCIGSGVNCHSVDLKMYDDAACKSDGWSDVRFITDTCYLVQNTVSRKIECTKDNVIITEYSDADCTTVMNVTDVKKDYNYCVDIESCNDKNAEKKHDNKMKETSENQKEDNKKTKAVSMTTGIVIAVAIAVVAFGLIFIYLMWSRKRKSDQRRFADDVQNISNPYASLGNNNNNNNNNTIGSQDKAKETQNEDNNNNNRKQKAMQDEEANAEGIIIVNNDGAMNDTHNQISIASITELDVVDDDNDEDNNNHEHDVYANDGGRNVGDGHKYDNANIEAYAI